MQLILPYIFFRHLREWPPCLSSHLQVQEHLAWRISVSSARGSWRERMDQQGKDERHRRQRICGRGGSGRNDWESRSSNSSKKSLLRKGWGMSQWCFLTHPLWNQQTCQLRHRPWHHLVLPPRLCLQQLWLWSGTLFSPLLPLLGLDSWHAKMVDHLSKSRLLGIQLQGLTMCWKKNTDLEALHLW